MKNKKYAPIAIFAFNRLDLLKATIASVLQNTEAAESDLFVFVDGARTNMEGESDKVLAVQEYVKSISGFKSVHYTFSDKNKGLGPSIIAGVTEVINHYGSVIVFEDDLILSRNCLSFMNQGLAKYENEPNIFCISAYTNKIKIPDYYQFDAYTCVRGTSWGWAIWKDRWDTIDWNLKDWDKVLSTGSEFNAWGGSDCFGMLLSWHKGQNQSWAIRYNYSQFIQHKLSIFPTVSKIGQNGFDGSGTNCKSWSRNKYVFDNTDNKKFIWLKNLDMDRKLYKSAMSYNTIQIRIWSRFMYLIYPLYLKYIKRKK